MKPIELLVFLFAFVFVAAAQGLLGELSCVGRNFGYVEISCKSFVDCRYGIKTTYHCKGDTVVDIDTMTCRAHDQVSNPCAQFKDCSIKGDGRYPDFDYKCKSFYTCHGGSFLEHNFCPTGLVFNEAVDICDWPYNVYPPCGTKLF